MKKSVLLSAVLCALFLPCLKATAAPVPEIWKGTCGSLQLQLTLLMTGSAVSGTMQLGRETYDIQGSVDNATDNATITLSGKGGAGFFTRTCTTQLMITSPGQMSGTVTVKNMLGLKLFSEEAELENLDMLRDFNLLIGHVQQPSNIYLFFSLQDGNGKPVTGLTQADFDILEDDQPISEDESDKTIIPNPSVYTMSTVLLLDMSGSILESDTLEPLKISAKAFLQKVAGDQGQEVAIYRFDGRDKIIPVKAFTKNITELQASIDGLSKALIEGETDYDVSTNLNGAVQQGIAALDDRQGQMETGALFTGTLVTFTDGTDRAHRISNEDAVATVNACQHYSFAIGLGGEIDETHLKNLGKSGFAFADDAAGLDAAFEVIADTIRAESGKRYVLGYCSPSRENLDGNNEHKVTVRVKNHPGSLSYAFSSAGFAGGCISTNIPGGMEQGDSGQCLFQVQPASVRKPLLPRVVRLTIESSDDAVDFAKNSTISIEGLNVRTKRYFGGKLHAAVSIPATAEKKKYQVTVTTGAEKVTCFTAFEVK